jgi:hypothetical protein
MSAAAAPKAHQVEAISFCGIEEHEVAGIESLFDGHLADDVGHLELGDLRDSRRRPE